MRSILSFFQESFLLRSSLIWLRRFNDWILETQVTINNRANQQKLNMESPESFVLDPLTGLSQDELPSAEPLPESPQQNRRPDDTESNQMPTSFAKLPPDILEQIFLAIPARYRPVVAAVCYPWRRVFLGISSCWDGLRLGHDFSGFPTCSPFSRLNDILPLSHGREVRYTRAFPAATRDGRSKELLILSPWLSLVLAHAHKLKRLDLSSLRLEERSCIDAFR